MSPIASHEPRHVADMRQTLLETAKRLRGEGEDCADRELRALLDRASEVLAGVAGGFETYLRGQ